MIKKIKINSLKKYHTFNMFQLSSNIIYGTLDRNENDILLALQCGVKIVDTATAYDKIAKALGKALQRAKQENSSFQPPMIITKFNTGDFLEKDEHGNFNFRDETEIAKTIQNHHEDLGLKPGIVLLHSTFKCADDTKSDEYNARAYKILKNHHPTNTIFGISNFNIARIEKLIQNGYHPQIIELEFSLLYQPTTLIKFCKDNGIVVICYRLTHKKDIFRSDVLIEISNKHNRDCFDVALSHAYSKGIIPIISSTKKQRLESYFNFDQVVLDQDDIEQLDELYTGGDTSTCMSRFCNVDL